MRRLVQCRSAVLSRIANAPSVCLLLDFDGTIAPIVSHPDLAALSPAARAAIRGLRAYMPIAIISGRPLAVVRKKVGIPGISYVGSHGLEWTAADRAVGAAVPARSLHALQAITAVAEQFSSSHPGVVLERKPFGLSVHYRAIAPARRPAIARAIRQIGEVFVQAAHIHATELGVATEFRPRTAHDKGTAVRAAMKRIGCTRQCLPIYIGDEPSDEDAFRVIGQGGITIRVGQTRSSAAEYYVSCQADVDVFLAAVLHQMSKS